MEPLTNLPDDSPPLPTDDALFGWDPTPGIVSVWASTGRQGMGLAAHRGSRQLHARDLPPLALCHHTR